MLFPNWINKLHLNLVFSTLIGIVFSCFLCRASNLRISTQKIKDSTSLKDSNTKSSQAIYPLSHSSSWLKLLHYEKGQSIIQSPLFFLSPQGGSNPEEELNLTLKGLWNPHLQMGPEQLPVACAFPARKKWLEKELNLLFPYVPCEDLSEWLQGIHADRVSILFAGAYSQNPASLFGHALLRVYNEQSRHQNNPLLSYVIGFSATPDPSDSKVTYALKGLFGGYDGFWTIETFYEKLGAYNNSESRDLWEQELNFTADEVDTLLKALWELHLFAKTPYYFASKNCGFRLLSLLEIIRPAETLTQEFPRITIPYEVLRLLNERGWLSSEINFYSSLERRKWERIKSLSPIQKMQFLKDQTNIVELKATDDTFVLDALMDHWMLKNYQQKNPLSSNEQSLMKTTFDQRAKLKMNSPPIASDKNIRDRDSLWPPHIGHKLHFLSFSSSSQSPLNISYFLGAHPYLAPPLGYDSFAAIEYLGLETDFKNLNLTLIDIKSYEPTSVINPKNSWGLNWSLGTQCELCDINSSWMNLEGRWGWAVQVHENSHWIIYGLPGLQLETFFQNKNNRNRIRSTLTLGSKIQASQHSMMGFETKIFDFEKYPRDLGLKTELQYWIQKSLNFNYGLKLEQIRESKNKVNTNIELVLRTFI